MPARSLADSRWLRHMSCTLIAVAGKGVCTGLSRHLHGASSTWPSQGDRASYREALEPQKQSPKSQTVTSFAFHWHSLSLKSEWIQETRNSMPSLNRRGKTCSHLKSTTTITLNLSLCVNLCDFIVIYLKVACLFQGGVWQ